MPWNIYFGKDVSNIADLISVLLCQRSLSWCRKIFFKKRDGMKNFRFNRVYHVFLHIGFLFFSLQLQAIERDEAYISDMELRELLEDSGMKYVYLGKNLSNLYEVVSAISEFDENDSSILHELKRHIEEDFSVGMYDFVIEALGYAETVLQANRLRMSTQEAQDLYRSLEEVVT